MSVVLDASVAVAWLLKDEGQAGAARTVIENLPGGTGIVPGIFWYEVRNTLATRERKKEINEKDVKRLLRDLSNLPIEHDYKHDETKTLSLARHHRLSVYDAAYLETAIRRRAQIATFDQALAEAAREKRVKNLMLDILS